MNNKAKKVLLVSAVFFLMISLPYTQIQVYGSENEESIHYTIQVSTIDINMHDGFDEVVIDGFGHHFIMGKPDLPSKIITLALPPGASVQSVDAMPSETIQLEGSYHICPCDIPQTINGNDDENDDDNQDIYDENYGQIYNSDEPYPSQIVEVVRLSHFRKYDMVDIRVNPCTYYPLSGQLFYYPEIEVAIDYIPSDDQGKGMNDYIYKKELYADHIIGNYQQAQNWYEASIPKYDDLYDYVIITLDSLTSSVQPLVDWEESKGRAVNVVTTSWIDSNYIGYDLQEKMRNFLREKYPSSEWGIADVLLVGHYDDVPIRRCAQNVGYGQPETDYYYAELSLPDNESWDANENHQYGESSDPIDFYAEINVGRIPWSNPSIVEDICDKSVLYEQTNDPDFKQNILLLGAFFWPDTDNAELMEEVAANSWMNGWTKTRMYEQTQSSYPSDYDLGYDNVETNWSTGSYAFVNWAGHGSPTVCYEYYPSQAFVDTNTCGSLNDEYPAIVFADACSNQDTDTFNIGQAMMQQGAVGFLGSTEVAMGCHGWNSPYDGSSQSLDYFFTSKVTSCNYSAGQAHQWALSEMYSNGLWNYDYYETFEWGAYLGNPDLWMNISPMLAYNPQSYDFGEMEINVTDDVSFEIWNDGSGTLHYSLIESCDWISLSETNGESSGGHDTIAVTVDTTGLGPGGHHYDILIDTQEAGKDLFSVDLYIPPDESILDIDQSLYDRGFPVRHAIDGDWAGAQSFQPTVDYLAYVDLFVRKFGTPEFDLTVELRSDSPDGLLIDSKVFTPGDVTNSWDWLYVDFTDIPVDTGTDYFIVVPPAPSGVTTSFGYEWAYAIGNPYPDGAFWFTRDGGGLWRDLPGSYEFAFRIFGF